jgi:ketosteroid isomerase-like protein
MRRANQGARTLPLQAPRVKARRRCTLADASVTLSITGALLALLLLASCATLPAHDEAGVRAAMANFMDALNNLDGPRISACFAEDATAFVPVAQAKRANGRAEIDAIFRTYIGLQKGQTTHLAPQDMTVQTSGDMALVTFQIPGGSTARRTFVLKRVGGRWLIVHMHASNFRVQ